MVVVYYVTTVRHGACNGEFDTNGTTTTHVQAWIWHIYFQLWKFTDLYLEHVGSPCPGGVPAPERPDGVAKVTPQKKKRD